jgi:hypothetical protein
VNGLDRTWVSTGAGKISGSALDSRANARRFLSSRQEDVIGGVNSVLKINAKCVRTGAGLSASGSINP